MSNRNELPMTAASRNILERAEGHLKAACVSCPEVMLGCILDEAQDLVNRDGYRWDVALAKAVQIYPATKYSAMDAYAF